MSNTGELDEPMIVTRLVAMRGQYLEGLGVVRSVADYRGREFPENTKANIISKAPTKAKRDVVVNGKGVSLKSLRGAPSALVNHTTREKWLRICAELDLSIEPLDRMVDEYWKLRMSGSIGEDVWTREPACPFGNTPKRRAYLKRLINYFLFDGTGATDSDYPADLILEVVSPSEPRTWRTLDRDSAFETVWPDVKFSVRSKKGMPVDYDHMTDLRRKGEIAPWVRFVDGDYRGALHVRTR